MAACKPPWRGVAGGPPGKGGGHNPVPGRRPRSPRPRRGPSRHGRAGPTATPAAQCPQNRGRLGTGAPAGGGERGHPGVDARGSRGAAPQPPPGRPRAGREPSSQPPGWPPEPFWAPQSVPRVPLSLHKASGSSSQGRPEWPVPNPEKPGNDRIWAILGVPPHRAPQGPPVGPGGPVYPLRGVPGAPGGPPGGCQIPVLGARILGGGWGAAGPGVPNWRIIKYRRRCTPPPGRPRGLPPRVPGLAALAQDPPPETPPLGGLGAPRDRHPGPPGGAPHPGSPPRPARGPPGGVPHGQRPQGPPEGASAPPGGCYTGGSWDPPRRVPGGPLTGPPGEPSFTGADRRSPAVHR